MSHFLSQIYTHPELGRDALQQIENTHQRVTLKKGESLLRPGMVAGEYFCLENGLARSFVINLDGKDVTTRFFTEGSLIIDVVSLFQRTPSKENIITITPCTCWKINFGDFQNLFLNLPGFSEWGRNWMTWQLFECKQQYISMITESALDRYMKLVTRFPELLQHVPLKHIASFLGITDSSLSRIRKELVQNYAG